MYQEPLRIGTLRIGFPPFAYREPPMKVSLPLLLALALSAPVFSGCSCTEIGCEDAVRFFVSQDLVPGESYELEACVGGTCRTANLEAGPTGMVTGNGLELDVTNDRIIFRAPEDAAFSGMRTIALRLVDASGDVLIDISERVEMERLQPNGRGCPPVCWSKEMDV